jgi:hypothetical protein
VSRRVLVSARDPGAAAQLRPLVTALAAERGVALTVVASGAALDILDGAGPAPIPFMLADGMSHVPVGADTAPLLDEARRLVVRIQPDVIVTGISSLGVGVDEALLAVANGRPTFAVQDYPGDANAIDGAYAREYLVRDDDAARLTHARFGVTATPVGSLRHAGYAALDVPALRRRTREELGAGDRAVVGFFGQPPEIPGHEAIFGHLVEALAHRKPAPIVVIREHPKARGTREAHVTALLREGVAVVGGDEGAVESWLVACDVVTTPFSHCAMDFAFLSAASPEPIGAVLFLLTMPETWAFMREHSGIEVPDGVDAGLGAIARSAAEIPGLLDTLLGAEARHAYHAAALRLPRGGGLPAVVARVLEAAAESGAAP